MSTVALLPHQLHQVQDAYALYPWVPGPPLGPRIDPESGAVSANAYHLSVSTSAQWCPSLGAVEMSALNHRNPGETGRRHRREWHW